MHTNFIADQIVRHKDTGKSYRIIGFVLDMVECQLLDDKLAETGCDSGYYSPSELELHPEVEMRIAFEAWASENGMHDFRRMEESGNYLRDPTHICWLAWQGCMASLKEPK